MLISLVSIKQNKTFAGIGDTLQGIGPNSPSVVRITAVEGLSLLHGLATVRYTVLSLGDYRFGKFTIKRQTKPRTMYGRVTVEGDIRYYTGKGIYYHEVKIVPELPGSKKFRATVANHYR